jgi:phosphoribosylanthranilate isomerase
MFSNSPRSVPPERAREIYRALSPSTLSVAVSTTADEDELAEILSLNPAAIQIYHPFVLPAERPYQVFRVMTGRELPGDCDAIVLDKSHGSGKCADLDVARKVVEESLVPVILSGGLTPENVHRAIDLVKPYAVDVASGIEESSGKKNPEKMKKFMEMCQEVAS